MYTSLVSERVVFQSGLELEVTKNLYRDILSNRNCPTRQPFFFKMTLLPFSVSSQLFSWRVTVCSRLQTKRPSQEAVTTMDASGEKAADLTLEWWPLRVSWLICLVHTLWALASYIQLVFRNTLLLLKGTMNTDTFLPYIRLPWNKTSLKSKAILQNSWHKKLLMLRMLNVVPKHSAVQKRNANLERDSHLHTWLNSILVHCQLPESMVSFAS